MLKDIWAIVLCGGMGKRLRTIVWDRAKPMAIINDRPFLDIILSYLFHQGIRKIILSTGYLGHSINEYYQRKNLPFRLIITQEPRPLGTAGAIKYSEKFIDSPFFFVCNGDSFCPFSLAAMSTLNPPLVTVGVTEVLDRSEYGSIEIDPHSWQIKSFQEKRVTEEKSRGLVNGGIYFFSQEIFKYFPQSMFEVSSEISTEISLEQEIFPQLLSEFPSVIMKGHLEKHNLWDIGTEERLLKAKTYFEGELHEFEYAFDDK